MPAAPQVVKKGWYFVLKQTCGIGAVMAVGLALTLAGPAQAETTDAPVAPSEATIYVPVDFASELSDTRTTGHYEVVDTGLHVWTEGNTSTDKVAEYVTTSVPLAGVGTPSLDYTDNAGGGSTAPGFQLIVDFDGDTIADGILVGETVYGDDWWLSNGAAQFVKDAAPSHAGGSGSANHGTLDQWRAVFPDAVVTAFGFSLGSGVLGDGVLNAIDFAGTHYTFADAVVLSSKNECKSGGWATSTVPVCRNQGDCVSHFATMKD
jgi:hypothetical protein